MVFILVMLLPYGGTTDYPLKNGRPTSKGIARYIEDRSDSLIMEYQNFVEDTLFNVWIYADDLNDYSIHDSLELGRYYPYEIYITTAELFLAYELDDLTKKRRTQLKESNRFVKAAVFHELTHNYIHQISVEMQALDSVSVNRAYQIHIWIIRSHETFGSIFIEEGLCEYMVQKMGELIPPEEPLVPSTVQELISKRNQYMISYKYSAQFLKTFLDTTGFKNGVKLLLHNAPPNYEEILHPDKFFTRLNPVNHE